MRITDLLNPRKRLEYAAGGSHAPPPSTPIALQ